MTPAQLAVLKTAILAETDPVFVGYRTNGQTPLMRDWFNDASTFVVYKTSETIAAVGQAISYVALEALTTANLEKINTFTRLNALALNPSKADIRSFWSNVFSGTLGGDGATTRTALEALWKRNATRAEKLFATGTGTAIAPGTLVFEGAVSDYDIGQAV